MRPSTSISVLARVGSAVLFACALLSGCLPDYVSGKTQCSIGGLCPGGFACVMGVCYTAAAPSADPLGGGIASATTGSSPTACGPDLPRFCPTLDDRAPVCTLSALACATVVDCAGKFGGCAAPDTPFDCAAGRCVEGETGRRCTSQIATPDRSPCGRCLWRKCCEAASACAADPACTSDTTPNPRLEAVAACADKFCAGPCS